MFRTSRLFLCTNMCFVFSYTHTSFEGSIIFAFFTEHTAASRFQRVAHRHQLIEVSFVFPFMNIYMLLYNTYTSLKKHTIFDFFLFVNFTSSSLWKTTLVSRVHSLITITNMCRLLIADHKPLQNTHVSHFIIQYSLISLSFSILYVWLTHIYHI